MQRPRTYMQGLLVGTGIVKVVFKVQVAVMVEAVGLCKVMPLITGMLPDGFGKIHTHPGIEQGKEPDEDRPVPPARERPRTTGVLFEKGHQHPRQY